MSTCAGEATFRGADASDADSRARESAIPERTGPRAELPPARA
jgi:hypothetical protein